MGPAAFPLLCYSIRKGGSCSRNFPSRALKAKLATCRGQGTERGGKHRIRSWGKGSGSRPGMHWLEGTQRWLDFSGTYPVCILVQSPLWRTTDLILKWHLR